MLIDPKFYVMAEKIRQELPNGGVEDDGSYLPKLGACVAMAGDGDHLDIGTGWGASAIMAAMVKQEFTLSGNVYCIDPYPQTDGGKMPTMNGLNDNAVHFAVADRMVLMPMLSYPLPVDVAGKNFASCFLDGDKEGMNPWLDFLSVRGIVKKMLFFGGYEECYPGVMVAGMRALSIGGWILHYKDGNFLSIRRPVDLGDWMKLSPQEKLKKRQMCWV